MLACFQTRPNHFCIAIFSSTNTCPSRSSPDIGPDDGGHRDGGGAVCVGVPAAVTGAALRRLAGRRPVLVRVEEEELVGADVGDIVKVFLVLVDAEKSFCRTSWKEKIGIYLCDYRKLTFNRLQFFFYNDASLLDASLFICILYIWANPTVRKNFNFLENII